MSRQFPSSVRSIEIEQKCEFGFTEKAIQAFLSGYNAVTKYLYIPHGRSQLNDQNEPIQDIDDHYHLYLWFKSPQPTENILSRLRSFGVTCDIQQLEKIKKDDSAVAYATHENVDKPKYPRSLIKANFDFNPIIDKEAKKHALRKDVDRLIQITSGIEKGEIKEYNINSKITMQEYITYTKEIKLAFEYRANMLRNEVSRSMECIFITGDSGTGKSTYAKKIAAEHNYSVYVSSGSNDVLDGYGGQECLILDDLRPSSMGLADLLKMLDNNTASTVKSRYRNKILECRMIIITTTLGIEEFFKNVFAEQKETIVQLKRRCKLMIRMSEKSIETYLYDENKRNYELLGVIDNIILLEYKKQSLTNEQKFEIAKRLLGSTGDMLKNVSNKMDFNQMSLSDYNTDDNPF